MIKFNDIILRDDCNVFNAYYDQPSLSCYADPHGANHRPSFDHVELLDYDIILQISDIDIHIPSFIRYLFRHILSKQVFEMSMLVYPLVQNPSVPTSRSFPK